MPGEDYGGSSHGSISRQRKDKKAIGNSQNRIPKSGFCLSVFCKEMMGSVDEEKALDNVYLAFSKVCNTVCPSIENKLA